MINKNVTKFKVFALIKLNLQINEPENHVLFNNLEPKLESSGFRFELLNPFFICVHIKL